MQTKITKYTYECDSGSLRLISERGSNIMFSNKTGDGDYPLYLIEADGWGPALFKDKKEYEIYKEFYEKMKRGHATQLAHLYLYPEDESWKVSFYDCDSEWDCKGILLDKTKYDVIYIYRHRDTFYIYAYYRWKK